MEPLTLMSRTLMIAAAALALSACSSLAKPTVESELRNAGLGASMASCMAKRMTDRLSLEQLRKLSRLKGQPGEKVSDLSAGEILARVRRIDDPEVVSVVTSSGAACALTS